MLPSGVPFRLVFAKAVSSHLDYLTIQQRVTVIEAIESNLIHEPLLETRNRKPLRPNPLAPWELRVGNLRVFYEPNAAMTRVEIVAIGVKVREKLLIGGEEVQL